MATPILATKLYIPPPRPRVVLRPRLIERLNEGLQRKLTLISASAGFGKTTLVSEWVAGCGQPVAWLSLDEGDNDPASFLTYLVAALQTLALSEVEGLAPDLGAGLLAILQTPQPPSTESLLTILLNEITTIPDNFVLVLDDYHVLDSKPVDEALTFLLEHLPPQMHLVIATREDPDLPLARLRARGQMTELRLADLRFTPAEAAEFLGQVMGLNLAAEDIAALEARTEGWIAGLQMAALSMRDHEDVAEFIKGFSGTNRYILDYLLEEVMAGQPPEIQHFLLYTSILERLTAGLCDAVLANDEGVQGKGNDRSTVPESLSVGQSASILKYLERANLFLVPLDDERIWYRYHHLFADLLRTQLLSSLGAQGVAQLHVRAADWHAQNGSILEAIDHASRASDDERVEHLISQNYMEMMNRGEQSWIRSWISQLSRELVYRRPWLCIYEAYSHSFFGELDEADLLLEAAEKRIRSEISAPDARSMQGYLAFVRSRVTAMRGDIHRAIQLCLAAHGSFDAGDLAMGLDTGMTLGYEYFIAGDYGNASPLLNETIRLGITAGSILNTVPTYCVMARLVGVQGRLSKSYDLYQAAAQFVAKASGQHLGAQALIEVGMADVLCERNDLDGALAHLKQGLDLMPWWGKADDFILAYITLARIHLAQANKSDALAAVEKAIGLVQTRGVFSEARHAVEIAQVKLWLAQADLQAASRWAASQEKPLSPDDPFRFENELARIAQGRILIAQNKPGKAIGLLSHLEEIARSDGRMGRLLEIMILKALAIQRMGNTAQADIALTKCLTLAEPEGYLRIFLDEGEPMRLLISDFRLQIEKHPRHAAGEDMEGMKAYTAQLLAAFCKSPDTRAQKSTIQNLLVPGSLQGKSEILPEPLSERELEVLKLLRTDLNGPEIAHECMVSLSTVRTHTQNIYAKLGVNNRRAAVRRAEELDLF
jgi:LuxR family maltose regulon positive regulatory protein